MKGQNVGDLLDAAGVSWGAFMVGFDAHGADIQWNHGLQEEFDRLAGEIGRLLAHHAFFQYTRRRSKSRRGRVDCGIGHAVANHQYDVTLLWPGQGGLSAAVNFSCRPWFHWRFCT